MKQRHRKRQRVAPRPAACQPVPESSVASLDEGLSETFPAGDPVSVSVTRIEEPGEDCSTPDSDRKGA